jgi:uncharacterized coiled-coil protein SlyX
MENNPLYRLYVQLNDRIDLLAAQGGSTGSSGNTDVSDLVVRLRELENRPSLEGVIHQLSNSIEELKRENEALKSHMECLNKFENIESRLYNLEVEPKVNIEPLNARVASLENSGVNDRVSNLEVRMNNTEQYTNIIPDLSYRVSELEKRPELSQRLNAIEATVAGLNSTTPP